MRPRLWREATRGIVFRWRHLVGSLSDLVGQPLHSQLPACGGSRMDRQAINSAADGPVSSRTRSKKQ